MYVAVNPGANAAIMAASIAASNSRRRRKRIAKRRRIARRRILAKLKNNGEITMSNELIGSFVGKEVTIETSEGEHYKGKLLAVEDNWIKLEEKTSLPPIELQQR